MNLSNGKGSLSTVTSSGTLNSGDAVSAPFPAGLRVLVVIDDPTCLMILEKMLRTCLYEVTKCNRAETALSLLRENKNGFDIVISDVHMPDMDGFKLLEHIGLEMDLPVIIMMSADDGKSVVMKGVTHGACDYLIKPVHIEALKNTWQHVIRKKRNEDEEADERDDTSTLKKPRVVWSVELHQQFVAAVDKLGIDKAVPRKILELMNVPGLTRENVASHLQKYRLYLRRLSGVSHHQNNMNNSFLSPQETLFGAISSINGIDLQTLAATGQLPAQSLATLQAAGLGRSTAKAGVSMPLLDQRNLFSFENPRLRFGEGQQQHLSTSKPMNLLRGIPTNMEPKQLANLHQSTKSLGNLNTQVNTGVKGSGGFPCYDIFNELHHQKSQDWETTNPGLMYDSSQHANPLQVNIDVSPSVLVHQGYSSTQQNGQSRDAPLIGKTIFSLGEGLELGDLQNAGQLLIPLLVDNSVRVKTERVPDASSQNNLFSEHYGQEDLMSALLKQVIHIYTYIRKNVIGRGDSTKSGQPGSPAEISNRQNRWIFRFSFLCFLALLLFLIFILIKKKEGSVFDLRQTMASAF